MSEVPEWLKSGNEGELRAAIKFTDPHKPGVICHGCTMAANANHNQVGPRGRYLFRILHPAGRIEHGRE
jgi:hypothetical protein